MVKRQEVFKGQKNHYNIAHILNKINAKKAFVVYDLGCDQFPLQLCLSVLKIPAISFNKFNNAFCYDDIRSGVEFLKKIM